MESREAVEKADLLGEQLVGGATEIATMIVEEVAKVSPVTFRDGSALQFAVEIIVFYMHLVDRMAFAHLLPAERKIFGDRFIVAVVKETLRELSRDVSADDFGDVLRDTYNKRQMQYARYGVFISGHDQPLKDTLYWEFSKILFGLFKEQNPATLIHLNLLVADCAKIMLVRAEEVLRS
jgi:hypothetical protein